MMKSFLLIILTLVLSTGLMAKSQGSFKLLTHEEYVHLTDKQKNEYHILIMELMVELESQYTTETKTYGFNPTRLEKFKKAVTKLQNILIPTAYAAPLSPQAAAAQWNRMAQDFSGLSTRSKVDDGNCVFAGWISRVRRNNCIHPMAAEFNPAPGDESQQTAEFKSYPRDPSKGCNAGQMRGKYIQCNPLIFGYKKKSEGTLFCVSTDNLAENSSYRCMTAALETTKTQNSAWDQPEQRLADLRSRYSQPENAQAFNSVFMFNFKTCICPTAPNEAYSTRYQNHIRPDVNDPNARGKFQACYGMMKMMDKTLIDCAPPTNITISEDTRNIFESFRQFTANDPALQAGSAASSKYVSFIRNNLQTGSSSAAYSNLCSVTPVIVTPEDTRIPTCSIACGPKSETTTPTAGLVKSNDVMTCSIVEIKVPGPDNTMTSVSNPTITGGFTLPAAVPADGSALSDIEIKFTTQGVTGEKTLSCPATYTPAEVEVTPQGTPTCKAACTFRAASAADVTPVVTESKECTITEIKLGDTALEISKGTIVQDTVANGSPVSASITPGENIPAVPVACDTNWTPDNGGSNEETLSVTKVAVGETKYKVTATGSNAVGWSIQLKSIAPGTESGQAKNIEGEDNKVDLEVTRRSEPFRVCGYLEKTPDKKEECTEIPKLGDATTPDEKPGGNPVNIPKITPPQPAFMRTGSDTSARGIK